MLPDLGKCSLLVLLAIVLPTFFPAAASAQDNGLVLYGAGSLREAMTDMAALFTRERGIAVQTEFGASGRSAGQDRDRGEAQGQHAPTGPAGTRPVRGHAGHRRDRRAAWHATPRARAMTASPATSIAPGRNGLPGGVDEWVHRAARPVRGRVGR